MKTLEINPTIVDMKMPVWDVVRVIARWRLPQEWFVLYTIWNAGPLRIGL